MRYSLIEKSVYHQLNNNTNYQSRPFRLPKQNHCFSLKGNKQVFLAPPKSYSFPQTMFSQILQRHYIFASKCVFETSPLPPAKQTVHPVSNSNSLNNNLLRFLER